MRKLMAFLAVSAMAAVLAGAGGLLFSPAQADVYEDVVYTSPACGVVDIVNERADGSVLITFQGVETSLAAGDSMVLSDPGQEVLEFSIAIDRGVFRDVSFQTDCAPADSDGDGVPDSEDACPDVAGNGDDGCPLPPPDSDGDGVPDDTDACPNEAGEGADGCPLPPVDSDGDGVPDDQDQCADTPDGVQVDENGCVVEQPKKVYVCKYVGTPGVDEVLQTGQNPIEVSVNAIGQAWNGNIPGYFNDQHGRSYVLGYVPMTPEPTADDCPSDEDQDPEYNVTVSPNQGSCDVLTPEAEVTTDFESSIGYTTDGADTVWVHTEVPAGTYTVTLPAVEPGESVTYALQISPLDDSADPIFTDQYTFTAGTNCDADGGPGDGDNGGDSGDTGGVEEDNQVAVPQPTYTAPHTGELSAASAQTQSVLLILVGMFGLLVSAGYGWRLKRR